MTPGANGRRPLMLIGAAVAGLVILIAAYSNSFENSFHFDDSHVVENNLYIRSLKNVPQFFRDASTFSSFPSNATYRPLVTATLAFDYWLGGGLQPRQFHRSQLAMLIVLSVMIFFLYGRLFDETEKHWWNPYLALVATMFFAVHTTSTETMNLIHARSELLSVIGVVGSFLVYLYAPRTRRAHLYLLPMIVGALAKNQAVIFAPLFLVYLVLFEQGLGLSDVLSARSGPAIRAALWKSLPAFVVALIALASVEAMNVEAATYGGGGRLEYFQTQLFVWLHYARLFVFPIGLTADTDWRLMANWYDTRVIAGACFVALLIAVVWMTSRMQSLRPVAFGFSWFALALLPASSVVPLAEVVNEHRVFFPYVGLTAAVFWGLAIAATRWSDARPRLRPMIAGTACMLAVVSVSANAVGTYERNTVWRTEETLWKDVAEKSPENGRGLMNYGLTQMAQGKFAEAKQLFERALVYTPNYAALHINLAIVNDSLGNPALGEQYFAKALELEPNYPAAHSFYARWLVQRGRISEAIPHLQKAVSLSPANIEARYQLLDAYARMRQTEALKALAVDTLSLVPGDQRVRQYLDERGEVVLPPAAQYSAQVPSTATTPDGWLNVSLRAYQSGDYLGSIDAAQKAIALKADLPEAYNNIAAAYASLRQWDDAIQAANEALRLKPDFPLARNNLAWAESEKRKALK